MLKLTSRWALVVLMAFIVPACAGSAGSTTTTNIDETTTSSSTSTTTRTIPPTTTTTLSDEELAQIQFNHDVQAIKQLWRGYSDSWFTGLESGYGYLAANNYPAEECTAEDFASDWEVAEGFHEEAIVDVDTIERDDGWSIPGGQASGTVPEGRIYIMSVTFTSSAPGFSPSEATSEVHTVTTPESETYFFFPCGKD